MKWKWISQAFAAVLIHATLEAGNLTAAPDRDSSLVEGFQNPPPPARPSTYYLMLNGYLNSEHVDAELEALAQAGISGLCVFDMGGRGAPDTLPPAGPPYMSDAWLDQFARVIHKAGELGMEAQLSVSSSWDMGASWVQPEDASMALYYSSMEIQGPRQVNVLLPLPQIPAQAPRDNQGKPLFLMNVAALAVPTRAGGADQAVRLIADRGKILDMTGRLGADGRLQGELPAGSWTILRLVCANTGERLKVPSPASDGLATDHFSARVTRSYIRHLTARLRARFGDLRETALKQLYLPSYEVRGRLWTPDLPEQFQRYRGYDLIPFLPALVGYTIENEEVTRDFLHDFQKTMGDLLVDAYYRTASDAAHEAGLGVEAEAGGPGPPVHQVPVDALKALGSIDEIRGEFWPWRLTNDPMWVVKETACAAHIYGRRRVHMESFTGFYHWESGPFDLKFSADRAFCEGMNHVVWHTCSHQPPEAGKPGWVYGAGTHLSPNLIWWPKAKPFLDYLGRCSFLLQQGLFVADVCRYYGDQGSNFVPPKHVDPSLGYGYDYDEANPEIILNRMSVRDGRVVLPDGMSYAILTLPDREDMDVAVLRRVTELVKQGATVAGRKPVRASGLGNRKARDEEVKRLADALWGNVDGAQVPERRHGQGTIVWGRTLRDVLRERGIEPDFRFVSEDQQADLDFIHRRTEDADIYFVRNVRAHAVSVEAVFRVSGRVPEIWDPASGEILAQPVYRLAPRSIRMPLRLAPWGSVFVVFRDNADRRRLAAANESLDVKLIADDTLHVTAYRNGSYDARTRTGSSVPIVFTDIPSPKTLDGPWQVNFRSPLGDEIPSAEFEQLVSWTESEREDLRHFSGVARYRTDFEAPSAWLNRETTILLDLGRLWAVGEVYLNGRSQGILWKPPYRLDVTDSLKSGRNVLEIEVANTWANRLIGDALLPAERRRTRTNITRSGGKTWKDKSVHESGLLGPVQLIPARSRTIKLATE